jgi:hypothetical protein
LSSDSYLQQIIALQELDRIDNIASPAETRRSGRAETKNNAGRAWEPMG